MKAQQESRTSRLTRAITQELGLVDDKRIHSTICKVTQAKNIDDTLRSLEYLLQTIVQNQGKPDFIYESTQY